MSACIDCCGPIDAQAYETKAKIAARLKRGVSVGPPKRCTDCTLVKMLTFAFGNEETEPSGGTPEKEGTE